MPTTARRFFEKERNKFPSRMYAENWSTLSLMLCIVFPVPDFGLILSSVLKVMTSTAARSRIVAQDLLAIDKKVNTSSLSCMNFS